jgi:hypothetical protein
MHFLVGSICLRAASTPLEMPFAASPTLATSTGGSGCTMPSGRTSIMFAVTR